MKLTTKCHLLLKEHLSESRYAIDATVGNGWDMLFLSQGIKENGIVFGFDIQEIAINKTKQLLESNKLNNFQLHLLSHDRMKEAIHPSLHRKIDLIIFNLGYLPQGDQQITTNSGTSIQALSEACKILRPDGIISVMVYPGHEAGKVESRDIQDWIQNLPPNWTIERHFSESHNDISPYLLFLRLQSN